jgi:CRP-like cAMP-binding protein
MIAPGEAQPTIVIDRFATLRASPLLREFTDVGLRILAEVTHQRSVGRGTYGMRAGDPSDGLSIVARGTLQLRAREGSESLGEILVGDALGGVGLLAGGEHLVSAWAISDVELVVLSRDAFEKLRNDKPGTAIKLLLALSSDLAERLREARGPMREFLAWQVSKRKA